MHDLRFVEAWQSSGWEVEVLAVDDVEAGDSAPGEAFSARFHEVVAARPPQLVQVGPLTWPGAIVASMWGGPLIAASWGFDLMHDIDEDPSALMQARDVLRRADLVFVDNDGPARRAHELGASSAAVVAFPWGIDLAAFTSTPAERDEHRIVSVRRHEPLYRVDDVINAFAIAATSDDRLRLSMAGSGSLTASLQERAVEQGIADRVEWLGDLSAEGLGSLLRSSGMYVSSSPVDGSSVSLLEAMASGIAVAVTDIEGNRHWVDERTGWMFPPGDTDALASLMVHLTAGATDLTERRRRARERVAAEADWEATVARFPSFAESAIAAAHRRGWLG